MTSLPRLVVAAMVLLAETAGAQVAPAPAPRDDVRVRTAIDRTALFVGDRATYTVWLTCKRGVEVLADDLSRDKLKLDGLEVVDGATEREAGADGTTAYTFRFVVTTYRVDAPALSIAPLTVRYAVRRSGQRLEDASPAGEVQVPGAALVFRSVLTDEPERSAIRTDRPPHARAARFSALQPIGIGLVILSIVPVLAALATFARRARRPRVRRSARLVRQEERESLETVRAMAADTVERRREAFTTLDALVRRHLSETCDVTGASLTPHEVPFALAATRANVPAELVASVLETCEIARYGPPDAMPSADAWRRAIEQVEQIVA